MEVRHLKHAVVLTPAPLGWESSAATTPDWRPSAVAEHPGSWKEVRAKCFPSLSKFWFMWTQWCRKQKVQLWSLMGSLSWTVTLAPRPRVPRFLAVPYSRLYCWRAGTGCPSESSCPGQTSPSSSAACSSCIFPGCPKSVACHHGTLCTATRCGSGTTGPRLIPTHTAPNRHNQTVKNQSEHGLILTLWAWQLIARAGINYHESCWSGTRHYQVRTHFSATSQSHKI